MKAASILARTARWKLMPDQHLNAVAAGRSEDASRDCCRSKRTVPLIDALQLGVSACCALRLFGGGAMPPCCANLPELINQGEHLLER